MTRNLRHDLKRVAAGVCALMLVSGTVPVKPIAEVINTAIVASAEGNTDFDFTFNEVTEDITADDVYSLQVASTEKVRSWICKNAAAISQANPEYDNDYYFAYIDTVDGNNVICIFNIPASDMQDSDSLEEDLIYGSDIEPGIMSLDEENVNAIVGDANNSRGTFKVYLCAPSAATPATVGTWTSGGCTLTLFDTGTLTVSKSADGDGVMADYYDYDTRDWKNELKKITNIVVEEGVTSIGIYAFYKCTNLTSVTLPEGLTTIDSYAFSNCISLTNVDLPEGLTTIGASAFNNCPNLTSVTLPEGLTTIGNPAFERCENLTSITIPSTVTSIRSNAFLKCTSVTHVYCYPNAADLTWGNSSKDFMSGKATQCHVKASQLAAYQTKFSDANVTFVGDLPETIVGTWTSGGCTVKWDVTFTIAFICFLLCFD